VSSSNGNTTTGNGPDTFGALGGTTGPDGTFGTWIASTKAGSDTLTVTLDCVNGGPNCRGKGPFAFTTSVIFGGGGLAWSSTAQSEAAAPGDGYIVSGANVVITLPALDAGLAVGDTFGVIVQGNDSATVQGSAGEGFQFAPGTVATSGVTSDWLALPWVDRTAGTAAANREWTAIASDYSGANLVALVNGGDLWTSSDSGATWFAVTSDSTGQNLAAGANQNGSDVGDIWTSTDSGATWTNQTVGTGADGQNWSSLAYDSTGKHLYGASYSHDIWTQRSSWVDETTGTPAANKTWMSIASSVNGSNLAAVAFNGDIWTSSNSGASWTNQTTGNAAMSGKSWYSIASDASGANLAAAAYDGDIWTSTDSGSSWANRTSANPAMTGLRWFSIASDTSGNNLAAGTGGSGDIWTSSDSGMTWINRTAGSAASGRFWSSIASNSTGSQLAAIADGEGIWTETLLPSALVGASGATLVLVYTGNGVFEVLGETGSWTGQ